MTDPDLVAKKLALIETCVRELRTLARPAELATDRVQERFDVVNVEIVRQVVTSGLDDLLRFVATIRPKLT